MAFDLSSIGKTKHSSPPRVLIHGAIKVGKSTFASQAPNPIFIRTEDGLNGVDTSAFPLCGSFNDLMDALITLQTQPHSFKTVVLDSGDWAEALIHKKVCHDDNVKSIALAGGGYGNGYNLAMGLWDKVIASLDDLNMRLGMIAIVICHSAVVALKSPDSEAYDISTLKLHQPKKGGGAGDLLAEWADVIGYARQPVFVKEAKDGSNKVIGMGGGNELVLGNSPASLSGNRYNLPDSIPLNWGKFSEAMSATNK